MVTKDNWLPAILMKTNV